MNYKIVLGIQYNGNNYYGWQKQYNIKTLQYILELAISKIANHTVIIKCAGRTDKKVHALEQIIHFETITYRKNINWVKGTNHFLPYDIKILWAIKINLSFHATLSAIAREYLYIINNNKYSSLFLDKITSFYPKKINLKKIKKASSYLIGKNDFSTFKSSKCQSKNSIKNIFYIKIIKNNNFIFIFIKANSFLYHMVRNIIGNLLLINNNNLSSNWMKYLLYSKNRKLSYSCAKPEGLYLYKVYYKKIFFLPYKILNYNFFNFFIKNNI